MEISVVAVWSLFWVGAQCRAKGPRAASSSPSRADPMSLRPSGECGAMSVMLVGGTVSSGVQDAAFLGLKGILAW